MIIIFEIVYVMEKIKREYIEEMIKFIWSTINKKIYIVISFKDYYLFISILFVYITLF